MSERGGPTTQSGILYQNSVAALYLGRLCDATQRPGNERVIRVRVEAPIDVDDIVVTFADEHKVYIQAKENLVSGGNAWQKVWRDFDKQFHSKTFQRGKDCLLFQIGNWRDEHDKLRELCQRAYTSENYKEWQERLNEPQKTLVEKIELHLPPELLKDDNLLDFIKHVRVEIWPLSYINRDLVPHWMPQSNKSPQEMFRLLRDRVGGEARVRGAFIACDLRESLESESPDLQFATPTDIESLRDSIKNSGSLLRQYKHTIAHTGYHIRRPVVDDIVTWVQGTQDPKNVAMLIDQAGMGKTVILRDVLCELERNGIDVLAVKADQQISGVTSIAEIQQRLDLPQPVEQILARLAKLGRVVILIDQVDALSLSLAHDQRTLDIVIDFVARLRRIPNVRIVLSCRLFDRNSDPRLKRIEIARQFTLDKLSQDELKGALIQADVDYDSLTEPTQKLLQTPLHLDLFVLALENQVESKSNLHSVGSLQELYRSIWQNVVLKQEPNAPSLSDRVAVINLCIDYMDREQRTSVPQTLLQTPETKELEPAVNWLASAGIIVRGKTEWTFLHQTLSDYCYAHQFVERGNDIVNTVLTSDQGIRVRPKLIQVLSYLRDSRQYLRDWHRLLDDTNLRYHLYDLLLRWFGALPNPTDDEWLEARRMFLDPEKRYRLLSVMHGNIAWFNRLYDALLPSWLSNEEGLDRQVIPYLVSMVDIVQAQVVDIVKPYLGRSETWDKRVNIIISSIRHWHTTEAIELFEQIVYGLPSLSNHDLYKLGVVAKAYPQTGCRLIRHTFDRVLNQYLEKREQERKESNKKHTYSFSGVTLYEELGSLDNSQLEDALKSTSQAEPKLFVKTMVPWLEEVLLSRDIPDEKRLDRYVWDELSSRWYENAFRIKHAFIHSLIAALIELAKSEPQYFRQVTVRLAELPNRTPQQLLTHVYRAVPKDYADDACTFLIADQRRLNLGDHQQYDSRQVISTIYPYLNDEQRAKLEAHILAYVPIPKFLGVQGLRWRGIEQLHLLQSVPAEYLSPTGIGQLRQWERKFPNQRASKVPITSTGGFIGSPISEDTARKMSNKNWLRAMQKYKGAIEHKEFLKGGAYQLSPVLTSLIKENPERFYTLIQQMSNDIDDTYVTAFINGLAESDAPAEWLFDVVRRFAPQDGRDIKRSIAWSLKKRIGDNIPPDIIDLLNVYVYGLSGESEWWWSKGENHGDVHASYLNSDRGSAFNVLMRIFDHRNNDEALEHKWKLVEFAASDNSTALRVGAIDELTYMIKHDRERAISLFERLVDGHKALLESQYIREFLYRAFYKNFLRLQPYIVSIMNYELENVQEQGAQLACIAALSTGAMESIEAQKAAQDLAKRAMNGPPAWRRGAARIYSSNIKSSTNMCMKNVISLLDDEDEQIVRYISDIFFSLRDEHLFTLREFIQAYANSASNFEHRFAEYLWEHGLLDPAWTLSIIRTILDNVHQSQQPWLSEIEKMIRLVLRIYNDPTTDEMREETMDVFDILMERHSGFAQKVLQEWDQR